MAIAAAEKQLYRVVALAAAGVLVVVVALGDLPTIVRLQDGVGFECSSGLRRRPAQDLQTEPLRTRAPRQARKIQGSAKQKKHKTEGKKPQAAGQIELVWWRARNMLTKTLPYQLIETRAQASWCAHHRAMSP